MYTDIFPWLVKASYPLGWVLAVVALWRPRTPQGATAWVVALVTMPILAIPLFLVFGRSKFKGYSRGQEKVEAKLGRGTEAVAQVVSFRRTAPEGLEPLNRLAIDNIQPGFMKSDDLKILVDG
ncbi:MAG: hypothetical protein RBT63_08215, partial [Bdellovibrionales bacterium]|nr:hypothetical protein [Bdellovibrionales bacterium]